MTLFLYPFWCKVTRGFWVILVLLGFPDLRHPIFVLTLIVVCYEREKIACLNDFACHVLAFQMHYYRSMSFDVNIDWKDVTSTYMLDMHILLMNLWSKNVLFRKRISVMHKH